MPGAAPKLPRIDPLNPFSPRTPDFAPRAKSVIFLFMVGGPSQVDTFDYKPKLAQMDGQPMPESMTSGQQLAQLQGEKLVCWGPQTQFRRFGRGGLEMTTSRDVLEALSNGAGPRKVLISLGYSAWGQGQLESEIAENSWLTVGADPQVIFDTPIEQRYERALSLLGLQAWMLSPDAGHA